MICLPRHTQLFLWLIIHSGTTSTPMEPNHVILQLHQLLILLESTIGITEGSDSSVQWVSMSAMNNKTWIWNSYLL